MSEVYVVYQMRSDRIYISVLCYAFTSVELAHKFIDRTYTEDEQKYVAMAKVELDPTDYKVWVRQ